MITSGVIEYSIAEGAGSATKQRKVSSGLCTRSRQVFDQSVMSLLYRVTIIVSLSDNIDLVFRLFLHGLLRPHFVLLGVFTASIKRASPYFCEILKICHMSPHMNDLVSLYHRRHF